MLYRNASGALPPDIDTPYDCCIMGAGPAGVVLGVKLAEAGKRVLLLEGGGEDFEDRSQELYVGDSDIGLPYNTLDTCRQRRLGGTANQWGGRCRTLDAHDFEPRPDLAPELDYDGWPIGIEAIEPYLAEARDILNLRAFEPRRAPMPGTDGLEKTVYRWSTAHLFGGVLDAPTAKPHVHFADTLRENERLDVVLHANVVALELDDDAGRVRRVRFSDYAGETRTAEARDFVIAMGGIETSRFLLNENARHDNRLGNQGDMVGRCFMEHPHIDCGYYFISVRPFTLLPELHLQLDTVLTRQKAEVIVAPTPAFMREKRILNCGFRIRRMDDRALKDEQVAGVPFLKDMVFGEDYFFTGKLLAASEMGPHRASRVLLTEDRDRFGLRRAGLDLRVEDIDVRTIRETALEVGRLFIRSGVGRLRLDPWFSRDGVPVKEMHWGNHHMGGARMSPTAETGVVDSDCRVHGTENLFVGGSGVFSTGGKANPTLSIVQLALRLADHLSSR